MKERPILFSNPMVQAILSGQKVQTRRVIKPQPYFDDGCGSHWYWGGINKWNSVSIGCPTVERFVSVMLQESVCLAWPYPRCPYGITGDQLWVRETWATDIKWDRLSPRIIPTHSSIWYKANQEKFIPGIIGKWRPSIHMPRWANRVMLEITGVRVERVQDITPEDAWAEGIGNQSFDDEISGSCLGGIAGGCGACENCDPVWHFKLLWDELNAKRGYSWSSDPWVWVVEFKMLEEKNGTN